MRTPPSRIDWTMPTLLVDGSSYRLHAIHSRARPTGIVGGSLAAREVLGEVGHIVHPRLGR